MGNNAYIMMIFLPVAVLVFIALKQALTWLLNHNWKEAFKKQSRANGQYDRWLDLVERELAKRSFATGGRANIILFAVIVPIGFTIGFYLFGNIPLAALCATLVFMLVQSIKSNRAHARKEKVSEQLALAVRSYGNEYMISPQWERALGVIAKRTPNPLGGIFDRAYRMILANYDTDELLAKMAAEIALPYGNVFVQLMRLGRNGTAHGAIFLELANRIVTDRELDALEKSQNSGERLVALIITIAPLVEYFILASIFPETREFVTETVAGRLVMFISLISAILYGVLKRLTVGVDTI
ncbi:MAG: hypothetical protein HPY50_02325 [Firmicutes bacterium]|nr:hypothetical protein [Bacillota bacterium]